MILKHPGIYFPYTIYHMSSYLSSLVSSIKDFFGYTEINQFSNDETKKFIYCIFCLNQFISYQFDGAYMKDIVLYIVYLIPRKKIEINAKGSRGVVIHYLERIYMFLLRIRN